MISSILRRGVSVAGLATLALGLTPNSADACSCLVRRSGQPACAYRWTASAVFTVRVVGLEAFPSTRPVAERPASPLGQRRVRVAVGEAFSGAVSGAEIDIFTGWGDADCGIAFEPGREYLIYAYRAPDGSLVTVTCDPTKKIEEAAGDLAYLRSVPATPPHEGRLIGLANHADASGITNWLAMPPYPGARVIAEGGGLVRSGVAGSDGAYEILVPPGRYRVRAEVSPGMFATMFTNEVELKDARGCAVADVSVRYDGHVIARVVTQSGQAVRDLPVHLMNTANRVDGRTDADGRFDIGHVPPGVFMLSTPLTSSVLHPRSINLGPAERIELGTLVTPQTLRVVTIRGRVVDADGRAVVGARVYLQRDIRAIDLVGPAVLTDTDGRFSVAAIDGQRYRVTAEQPLVPGPGLVKAEAAVVAAPDALPVVVTLQRRSN